MDKKICMTIAGSDSGGGAGVQADLKTFAAMGVHGACVITALTAQNTTGVLGVHNSPKEFIRAQFEALHQDFRIGAAKTGMLSSRGIIETVIENIGPYPLVVDPVMVASSGANLLDDDAVQVLKEGLIPRAFIVTPNIPEAEALSGMKINDLDNMKKAAKIIAGLGTNVVLKGGHLNATDVLYYNGEFFIYQGKLLGGDAHGSGCTFASAITAGIARGMDLPEAVSVAKDFVTDAISHSFKPGKGVRIVNPTESILLDSRRFKVINELRSNISILLDNPDFPKLIPEVGINMAFAIEGASSFEDVAGIKGRIVRAGVNAVGVGDVEFGASRHVARIVLAAMNFDKKKRSAMNIRYSPELLNIAEDIGLTVSSFSREHEPDDVSTMEWGTSRAIESKGFVPDLIFDKGGIGKEAMIRVLGENPLKITGIVKEILNKIPK